MLKLRINYAILFLLLFNGLSLQVLGSNSLKTSSFFTQAIQQLESIAYKQTDIVSNNNVATKSAAFNCNNVLTNAEFDNGTTDWNFWADTGDGLSLIHI